VDIDEGAGDADLFGDASAGSNAFVAFADSSTATALGQLFVVHNDDDGAPGAPDVEIAQIDQESGAVVRQVDVPVPDGFSIDSSPVLTAADPSGTRTLLFVVTDRAGGDGRLVRVPIAAAATRDTRFGAFQDTGDVDATPVASPAFATLADRQPYVAIGTTGRTVRTFRTADLAPGAASEPLGADPDGGQAVAMTPVVPVTPSGDPPALAPLVYVVVDRGDATAQAYKLREENARLVTAATSAALAGAPAPGAAVTQRATSPAEEGRLVVTTADDLYLPAADLAPAGRLAADEDRGEAGFQANVAAVSGDLIFVARDDGRQLVLRVGDAQPVAAAEFTEDSGNAQGTSAAGQPSISRGFVQFASASGLFVSRTRDVTPPAVALISPPDGANASDANMNNSAGGGGSRPPGAVLAATAADPRGITEVTFLLDGVAVVTDTVPDPSTSPFATASPFDPAAPATFSRSFDVRGLRDGVYTLTAVASDGTFAATSAPRRFVVANPAPGVVPVPVPRAPAVPARRARARRITARVSPSRDRRPPFRFRTTGRVTPPAGLRAARACRGGRFSVQVKVGTRTVSTRRAALRADCTFASSVSFSGRRRFGRARSLRFVVRFLGSDRLARQTLRAVTVRIR